MWAYDLNTAGAVDPSGVQDNFDTREDAVDESIAFLEEYDGPLTTEAKEELRQSGKINVCEEIYEKPEEASWPARATSIWFLTVFESEDEDPDYPDTYRY